MINREEYVEEMLHQVETIYENLPPEILSRVIEYNNPPYFKTVTLEDHIEEYLILIRSKNITLRIKENFIRNIYEEICKNMARRNFETKV